MSAAAEVATEVIETVADAAEETVSALEMVNNLNGTTRKQQMIVLVAVGVTAALAGAAVSHFVTKKVMKTRYEMLMEEELEKTREFFANREHIAIDPSEPIIDPEDMLSKIEQVVQKTTDDMNEFLVDAPQPQLMKLAEKGSEAVGVKRNAFEEADITKLWDAQNDAAIAENKAHVITKPEFFEAENDWPQLSFTYFDGDGVLADEREAQVEAERTVGVMNLTRFGWLSEDDNVVYIRNPDLEVEYEVTQSMGTYAAEVHGFNQEPEVFEKSRGKIRYGED